MPKPSIVFIVSQPRAGSTLLQTMLAGHPAVCAPGEAWLMLPLVHCIDGSRRQVASPYDQVLSDDAVGEFVRGHLQGGWSRLRQEVGMLARRVFESVLEESGKEVLVDKTPRYYWIIEDLLGLLPDCRVVVLLRNPLAVLSSIIDTWTKPTRVGFLKDYRGDLVEAPSRLSVASSITDDRLFLVRYEDLVRDPGRHMIDLQRFIGLDPIEGLDCYGDAAKRAYGDPSGIHLHQATSSESVDKYLRRASESATHWRLLDDYRKLLGPGLLARLGYDDRSLSDRLREVRPVGTRLAPPLVSQIIPRPAEPVRSYIRSRRMIADVLGKIRSAA